MPFLLRGVCDETLAYFNAGDGKFETIITDPVPNMIGIWEEYNRWNVRISRGGGGESISEGELHQLDADAQVLFENIKRIFPRKHGAKDAEGAWNIQKAHNMKGHMTDSIRYYGRILVSNT